MFLQWSPWNTKVSTFPPVSIAPVMLSGELLKERLVDVAGNRLFPKSYISTGVAVGTGVGTIVGTGVGVDSTRYEPDFNSLNYSFMVFADMANPKPSTGRPLRDVSYLKVFIPMISPDGSNMGPPLFPGLIAA